ncbi:hypothetical protein [Xanthomonas maliensis]|uniref:hypothetical protein n=1 Tax=Xanthomonas maliensis TaxID=1321368 RepID=UPI0004CF5271|nr:hypothetical protein [Xanthomonas maliensis]KAB7769369.1 hypothetical protein CKY51_07230 [Xanthomonas maliensis]
MERCPTQPSWFAYYKENMEALGLAAPGLYGSGTAIVGSISAMLTLAEKMGPKVTVLELVNAGTKVEIATTIGTLGASWYLGAAVGSAAVATGRTLSCGTSLVDVLAYSSRNGLSSDRVRSILIAHPEIYDYKRPGRRYYASLAAAA